MACLLFSPHVSDARFSRPGRSALRLFGPRRVRSILLLLSLILPAAGALCTVVGMAGGDGQGPAGPVWRQVEAPFMATTAPAALAAGAIITVNSPTDFQSVNASDGKCTLREAITAANTNMASGSIGGECVAGSGDDAINFDAAVFAASNPRTINLGGPLPDLTSNIIVNGPGASLLTISGNGITRVFTVKSGAVVRLSGLTMAHGRGNVNSVSSDGGGVYNELSTLTITDSTIFNNTADFGAGIYNAGGTLTVINSTINDNRTTGGRGGGILNTGIAPSASGTLTIINSTIHGNFAQGTGGGICNFSTSSPVTATINNSTISGNNASTHGGGIFNSTGSGGTAKVTINNSTIYGNHAASNGGSDTGGGIYNESGPSTATLHNTIVARNLRSLSPSSFNDIAGVVDPASSFNLISVAHEGGLTNGVNNNRLGVSDVRLGLLADNGGPTLTHALLFGSLAIDAGSNTLIPPDTGDRDGDGDSTEPVPFDQRGAGFARVFGGTVDIGAFELNGVPQSGNTHLLVNTTDDHNDGSCTTDDCTLREAIILVNARGATTVAFDGTVFTPPGPHTINLKSALPTFTTGITINGPGANILTVRRDTGGAYRIFANSCGQETRINGLTVANGLLQGADSMNGGGGGIQNCGTLTLTDVIVADNTVVSPDGIGSGNGQDGLGGGLYNFGILTLRNSIVRNNAVLGGNSGDPGSRSGDAHGAGIYNNGGSTTVINSIIINNTATGGSGGYTGGNGIGGGIFNTGGGGGGRLTVVNSTIAHNTAIGGNVGGGAKGIGGGIYSFGILFMTNTTISYNNATAGTGGSGQGGGLRNPGTAALRNTIIAANTSLTLGPDVSGSFTSQGHNLIGKNDDSAGFPAGNVNANQDIVGTSAAPIQALLGPLSNNGGALQTIALLPGSPAIDGGDNSAVIDSIFFNQQAPFTDQRGPGFSRIVDGNADFMALVDIGSYEVQAAIENITDKTIAEGSTLSLLFRAEDARSITSVTAVSANSALVPNDPAHIAVTGTGSIRTLTITPTAGQLGTSLITVTVTSGLESASDTFLLTVSPGGMLQFSAATYTIAEDGGQATITVTRTGGATGEARVNYSTGNGTATAGSDYLSSSGTLVFADGITSRTFTVPINNDSSNEADETVSLTLSNAGGSGKLGAPATAVLTITNDDTPRVQISQANYSISEDIGSINIVITRGGDTSAPASVKYVTGDNTDVNFKCDPNTPGQATIYASRKCDYHIASGTLRFAAGEVSKQFSLSIVNDVYMEGPETFNLTLSNPLGTVVGPNTSVPVTILDDDQGGAANPIDDTHFFVRQLYVDLLSREPDPAGWNGWTTRIDQCGQPGQPPPPCNRVTVGGDGFLRSGEFFDRQFFVLRLYRTGLGRILRYDEVGDLAYVSGFLTDTDLELNKRELVADLTTRPEFSNRYSGLANDQFVDTLLQTAGVTVLEDVRQGWITALEGGAKTRAQVYREISERPEISNKYLHEAQVVSAYYGFFTRNPDGAYLNYLQRLDSGEINLADLANAFINASEYRQRFGH